VKGLFRDQFVLVMTKWMVGPVSAHEFVFWTDLPSGREIGWTPFSPLLEVHSVKDIRFSSSASPPDTDFSDLTVDRDFSAFSPRFFCAASCSLLAGSDNLFSVRTAETMGWSSCRSSGRCRNSRSFAEIDSFPLANFSRWRTIPC
jgi:hypothetical protein